MIEDLVAIERSMYQLGLRVVELEDRVAELQKNFAENVVEAIAGEAERDPAVLRYVVRDLLNEK